MTTTKHLADIAYEYGLDLYTYSPGDGVTRYRFAKIGEQTCYFSGNGITTLLGRKEARLWLLGYGDATADERAKRLSDSWDNHCQ